MLLCQQKPQYCSMLQQHPCRRPYSSHNARRICISQHTRRNRQGQLSTSPAAAGSSSPSTAPRICVLGAGVVGLTTALRLLQRFPEAHLTVYADKFGRDTTTAGAAGVWQPYKLSETPTELVYR
jgi:hypothetical protein